MQVGGVLTTSADREVDEIMQLAHKAGLNILQQLEQPKSVIAIAAATVNDDDHHHNRQHCEKRIVRDLSSLPLLLPFEQQQQQQYESMGHYDGSTSAGVTRSSVVSSSSMRLTSRSKALVDEIMSSVPVAQLEAILSPPSPVNNSKVFFFF